MFHVTVNDVELADDYFKDDRSELDIEAVTPGTSLVNDTINYTSHPSVNLNGSKIPNATLSIPLQKTFDEYKVHRFDCDVEEGVRYYLNDKLIHTDRHNVPRAGGSLQIKLWADGNKWWSGMPSKTDTFLKVKSVIAYFNTTSSLNNKEWHDRCNKEKKQCEAVFEITTHKQEKPMLCVRPPCLGNDADLPRQPPKSTLSTSLPSAISLTGSNREPHQSDALSSSSGLRIQWIAMWVLVMLFMVTK